jgi:hypothetical protein
MVLVYADLAAAAADLPALTQCADGDPATQQLRCALTTAASSYRVMLFA